MAKTKTTADAPGANGAAAAVAKMGDNTETRPELTEQQMADLAISHKGHYDRALAAKKAADVELKNVCKQIKADMGDDGVAIIKAMIDLETPEGEAKVRARIAAQAAAARYMALPLGTQIELALQEPDLTPSVDRAYDEGRRASASNQPAKPGYDPSVPQYASYMRGFHDHQQQIASGLRASGAKNESASATY